MNPESDEEDDQPPSEDSEPDATEQPPPQPEEIGDVLAGTFKSRFPIAKDPALIAAKSYDLIPTTGFIHACSTHSLAMSWGTKSLFTGSEDGFIRRYNFIDSINGKQMLSLGQRPTFVDTVVKGGVLSGYWENEQPLEQYSFDGNGTYAPQLSPVYALAVHSEALWLCAGLKSGGITVQSVRHSEGQIQAYLDYHTNAVSELVLDSAEKRLLSGSWDKNVAFWDLETGVPQQTWTSLSGQVATLAWQPVGGAYVNTNDDDKSMDSLFGDDDEEDRPSNKVDTPDKKADGHSFLSAGINGALDIWDTRSASRCMQLSGTSAPPWCSGACWSVDGTYVYAGRRNNTVEEYDVRYSSSPSRVLRFPASSGAVTAVAAMPNGQALLCASNDNLRLFDLKADTSHKKTPFFIIAGHHGAIISRLMLDPSGHYLLTASSGRGWNEGQSSDMVLCYEIEALN